MDTQRNMPSAAFNHEPGTVPSTGHGHRTILPGGAALVLIVTMLGSCFLARPRPGYAPPPKLEQTVDDRGCITDSNGYAKVKGKASGDAGFNEGTLPKDLDDDGQPDSFVRIRGRSTTIFASNNGCVRDLGDVRGTIVEIGEDKSEGFRPVLTYVRAGCSGLAGTFYDWRLKDGVLNPTPLAQCGCPDLARPNPNRHPMCPALRPR